MPGVNRRVEFCPGRQAHIEVQRIGAELGAASVDRTADGVAVELKRAGNDLHFAAVWQFDHAGSRRRECRDSRAGFIFSFDGRLSHSWKPRMRPSLCCGISE